MVSAGYRFLDGGLISHTIDADSRVKFHYDDPNPQPNDLPAAIELGLGGERWERNLAEIREINREHLSRNA